MDATMSKILDALELEWHLSRDAYELVVNSETMHSIVVATRWAGPKHSGPLRLYGFGVIVDDRAAGPDGYALVRKPLSVREGVDCRPRQAHGA